MKPTIDPPGHGSRRVPALLAVLALASSGCATRDLWETRYVGTVPASAFAAYARPDGSGLLVAYEAQKAGGRAIGRRLYSLEDAARLGRYAQPVFLPPSATNGLVPVPVVTPLAYHPARYPGLTIVRYTGDASFAVWDHGCEVATHDLPYYATMNHKPARVLLAPVALATDIAAVPVTAAGTVVLVSWGLNPEELVDAAFDKSDQLRGHGVRTLEGMADVAEAASEPALPVLGTEPPARLDFDLSAPRRARP